MTTRPILLPVQGGVNHLAVNKTSPPDQYTEEQFFEAGRLLARIEHGMQWAIGDWFNAIPERWSDRREACKEAGLKFNTAEQYGKIAARYEHSMRIRQLTFDHHVKVAHLPAEQRASLLRLAEWGEEDKDGKRKPWTASRLAQERDKILGRERVPLPDFDAKVNQIVDSLPKNVGEKVRTQVRHLLEGLKARFQREVEGEVNKRLKPRQDQLTTLRADLETELEATRKLRMSLAGFMSLEEFQLIRSCLHPDKYQDRSSEELERLGRAFEIFNRLRATVNTNMPLSAARARGWEKVHPRYKPAS